MDTTTTSYWTTSAALPTFGPLDRDLHVDVVVVGGGITGITTAYLLKQAGRTVALLERARCASIDTGHTTAHLTAVTDLRLQEIVDTFGKDAALAVWDAGAAAIDQIVSNIRRENIDCGFHWVSGYLCARLQGAQAADLKELAREAAVAAELGIPGEYVQAVPFFGLPGVRFLHQALFHPRKYLAGLLPRIDGDGSHVFENTDVGDVCADPLGVTAGPHRIRCRDIVFATHNPLKGLAGFFGAALLQSKLALYTSYVLGAKLPAGRIPEGLYWDTNDPYYYLRVERRRGHDYAIFGGEDHKTGQEPDTTEPFRRLEHRLRSFAPEAEIDHRWSGQVIETNDGLPFIGETSGRQFLATGFSGNGMTFGTLSAMMATDAILGRKNPWQELFDVGRKKLVGGTWSYLQENKDYPYYLLRDRIGGAEDASLDTLAPEEGKLIKLDGKKVAAYRDAHGALTLCSPVCTHLKCVVGWNAAEHTWDCPCHGSRFRPTGEVLAGPAEEPLEKLPLPVDAPH